MHDFAAVKSYVQSLKPSLCGRLAYYCLPYRKQVVLDNMRRVFAEHLSEMEIKTLAQAFYGHLLRSIKENIIMKFQSEQQMIDKVDVHGVQPVIDIVKQYGGVIILTGHFGNWEFAPVAGIRKFKEFEGRFHIIRKTLTHKWLEKILFRRYRRAGIEVIPKDRALEPILAALEKNDAIVFVMDQYASTYQKDGIAVDFFGQATGTYRSLAMIARYTGIPVVPAAAHRKADGRHVFEFYPALAWQSAKKSSEAMYLNTLQYNQALERLVLAHPEQWLWTHKRWKQ